MNVPVASEYASFRPNGEIGAPIIYRDQRGEFLLPAARPIARTTSQESRFASWLSDENQGITTKSEDDKLVRLDSSRSTQGKVTLLQRWVGCVESVGQREFTATIEDETKPENPVELVRLDIDEVSASDQVLLAEGATFYWSIGYQDSPGGQRTRISTLRFARYPKVSSAEITQLYEDADKLAAMLEG